MESRLLELPHDVVRERYISMSDADCCIVILALTLPQRVFSESKCVVELREVSVRNKKPVMDGNPKPRIICCLQQFCRAPVGCDRLWRGGPSCRDISGAKRRAQRQFAQIALSPSRKLL